MPKITTFLSYDQQAEEAVRLYTSVFRNSKITQITYYGDAGPLPKGTVMSIDFLLDGQPFIAINGGPHFRFTDAVSLSVDCATQAEIDEYSAKPAAANNCPVVGSPTGSVFPGKSIRRSSARC